MLLFQIICIIQWKTKKLCKKGLLNSALDIWYGFQVPLYLFEKRSPLEMCSFFFPSAALELVPLSTAPTLIIMVSRKDQVITWILLKHTTKTLRQAEVLHGCKLYTAWFIYVFNAPVKTRHSLAPVWSFILVLSVLTAPPHCSCYSLCSVNCPVVPAKPGPQNKSPLCAAGLVMPKATEV